MPTRLITLLVALITQTVHGLTRPYAAKMWRARSFVPPPVVSKYDRLDASFHAKFDQKLTSEEVETWPEWASENWSA
jgi:hypothetical protein